MIIEDGEKIFETICLVEEQRSREWREVEV
jgi:hypothetical protein